MASSVLQQPLNMNEHGPSYHPHLVWLDRNLEHFSNRKTLNILSEIDRSIKSFTCERDGIDYIRQQNDRNPTSYIIFIISGALSESIIPEIHRCTCILGFFIYCNNLEDYEHLNFKKLRAICTDKYELMDKIEHFIEKNDAEIDFSLLTKQESTQSDSMSSDDQHSIRNLQEDAARFLWFYTCHNYMIKLENDDEEEAKKEMIGLFREQYLETSRRQSNIDEFEKEPLVDNETRAIWWYTRNSFLFQSINSIFRKENTSHIYSCRYIIKLLCCQLKNLHKQYIRNYRKNNGDTKLRLYRGQRLELSQIDLLGKSVNNLISFNGFVSTTLDKNIAIDFCRRCLEGSEPVLIIIDIDMTIEQSVPFADIKEYSQFPEEQEILFSIGAVFRIKSVKYDPHNQCHKVRLSLSQVDRSSVNKYIERTYPQDVISADLSILFGKLLFDMGECSLALKHLKKAYNRLSTSNNHTEATYLNNIGVCYYSSGKQNKALKYYEKSLDIYKQTNDARGLGACYHNIASFYHAQESHDMALINALDALDYRHTYPLEAALTFDLLGCIYLANHGQEAARNNFQEALEIRLKYLNDTNRNHPDIGLSYKNLGKTDMKLSHLIDAEKNYSKAADIYRHNYPKSHPFVVEITKCLEQVRHRLK